VPLVTSSLKQVRELGQFYVRRWLTCCIGTADANGRWSTSCSWAATMLWPTAAVAVVLGW